MARPMKNPYSKFFEGFGELFLKKVPQRIPLQTSLARCLHGCTMKSPHIRVFCGVWGGFFSKKAPQRSPFSYPP